MGNNSANIGLPFDSAVAPGGYAWWYVDAVSADYSMGLTVIAFVGSVFSPFYWRARQDNPDADPLDYCAINIALTFKNRTSWVFSEWPRGRVERSANRLAIGNNWMEWRGDELIAHFDDQLANGSGRVRGMLHLQSQCVFAKSFNLDVAGKHQWWAIAPTAHVEARFDEPQLRFSARGYLDANQGETPLETAFHGWTWSRLAMPDETIVFYDAERVVGGRLGLAKRFMDNGTLGSVVTPPTARLPSTFPWALPRRTWCAPENNPAVLSTWLNAPFYSRSLIETQLEKQLVVGVHEALSLDRFNTRWVQFMLPYRMRRHAV